MQKLNAHTLPWPTDWPALFGRDAPLILEIGFGRAHFLLHLARTFPDHNIVGLEISNRCLVVAESKIEREKLDNVRVVHATAETALLHLFTPASLAQVHVNFPDPWFKSRHEGRRLMQRDTLDAMVSRLQPDGLFYLATDIIAYAEMSAALLAETPALDNLLPAPWANTMPGRVTTKYEATAEREGRDRYYFAYRRNHLPAPAVPQILELDMPHLVFTSPVDLDTVQSRFEPWEEQFDDGAIVRFFDIYRGRHSLLFEAFVKEETIEQRIAIILRQRQSGDFTVLISPLGHPRATLGVHQAVSALGRWLLAQHPDTQLVDSHLRAVDEDG